MALKHVQNNVQSNKGKLCLWRLKKICNVPNNKMCRNCELCQRLLKISVCLANRKYFKVQEVVKVHLLYYTYHQINKVCTLTSSIVHNVQYLTPSIFYNIFFHNVQFHPRFPPVVKIRQLGGSSTRGLVTFDDDGDDGDDDEEDDDDDDDNDDDLVARETFYFSLLSNN